MKVAQQIWENGTWRILDDIQIEPKLCLLFGSRLTIEADIKKAIGELERRYPKCEIITCSTAGNIIDDNLLDDTIICTLLEFEKTKLKTKLFDHTNFNDAELGQKIAEEFASDDLAYLLVLSTTGINAGNILKGINSVFQGKIPVSGGVAGDDTRFERTLVGLGHDIGSSKLVAVGFYSKSLQVAHGSKGGWDTFGPVRKVTKCQGNILYEIDNKPVLDLYKTYLGDRVKDLPGSALLFPFAILNDDNEPVVRGIQNIDEAANSLILFGDVEVGQNLQLMRANFDRLISGAGESAVESLWGKNKSPELAILISCVARRIVLGQLTEEELTEVKNVLGKNSKICGYYSYSELSPIVGDNACHLHNQTMTITTISED